MQNSYQALRAAWVAVVVAGVCSNLSLAAEDPPTIRSLREPAALVLTPAQRFLYVVNRRSGSISSVDLEEHRVVSERIVGQQLSDMVMVAEDRLLATDEAAGQLIVLEAAGRAVTVTHRIDVSSYPVSVAAGRDGRWCSVASLWSRRVTFLSLPSTSAAAHMRKIIDLPFAPRRQLLVQDDSLLIVADGFGGRLGVIDVKEGRLLFVHDLGVHNIRGLRQTSDGRRLIVAHQYLEPKVPATQDDVHWGRLMSNAVSWLDFDAVTGGTEDVYLGAQISAIDRETRGAGDPAGLDVAREGTTVVALAGVSQIAVSGAYGASYARVDVGKRPMAVTMSPDARWAYVANAFDDSVSVVDAQARQETRRISLGPRPELTPAQQGERLFYDATLSHDGWMSCHSCHTDGHTSGRLADTASDGSFGTPKRILSLLGARDTAPYAWNGSNPSLEEQIRTSLRNTMHVDYAQRKKLASKIAALTTFLRSLDTPPSVAAARGETDQRAARRGRQVFSKLGCNQCHALPAFTSRQSFDVGLTDERGLAEFNPPSLRGVSQRGRYFHDGHAATLDDVIAVRRHPYPQEISEEQLRDLVAYLQSL